jgi:hypothetical protein
MNAIWLSLISFFLTLFLPHISLSQCDPSTIRESVMVEGMIIIAQTSQGVVEIHAGKTCERGFKWDNELFQTELIPRPERWCGHLGLYHPQLKPPHKNVVHMVAQEYQAHYQSESEAVGSLNKYSEDIYNDSGLHVRFTKQISPSGEIFIDILVSQILINGEKPRKLQGSQNSKINVKMNT